MDDEELKKYKKASKIAHAFLARNLPAPNSLLGLCWLALASLLTKTEVCPEFAIKSALNTLSNGFGNKDFPSGDDQGFVELHDAAGLD